MKKYFHIITIGCQMNISDSERIAGFLNGLGFRYQENKYKSDLVILVTCGVRQSAEDRIYGLIPRIKKINPKCKIILTGCLSDRDDVKKRLDRWVDIWIPINQIFNLKLEILNKIKSQKLRIENAQKNLAKYLKIKPDYRNKFSAYVPIGNGCNNFCSYCVVPYARGREVYRPVGEIIKEVKDLVNSGYKEIILIAQNVNSYKSNYELRITNYELNQKIKSINQEYINFASLLIIINNIPGEFWIRFLTSHPKDMDDKLITTIAECKKVCHHIHLPIQAGDDEILKKMNRNYTVKHYKSLIKKIKKIMPDVSLTTDIIVGFPGETKGQFENSQKLCQEVKFDQIFSSKYSPRPGTAASQLDDNVPAKEKKRREETLARMLKKTAEENNKKYLEKIVDVLVFGKDRKWEWQGRTRTNKVCRIISNGMKIEAGQFVKVKICETKDFGLRGKII